MQEQHDRAVVAALEPINRNYRQALEQLLRHATLVNDVDTAVKIKAELAIVDIPQNAPKDLVGDWSLRTSTGYTADVTFRADGTGTHTGYGEFHWHIVNRTLYLGTKEAAPDKFDLPVVDGKLKGSNSIGNSITMKKK